MRKAGNNRTARTNPQRVTAVPTTWEQFAEDKATSGSGLWKAWDGATAELNRLWPTIPAARFQEDDTAFGQWKMPIGELLLYIRDNEIHHRGQGYLYLGAAILGAGLTYRRSFRWRWARDVTAGCGNRVRKPPDELIGKDRIGARSLHAADVDPEPVRGSVRDVLRR
jgi:hypothetical protein